MVNPATSHVGEFLTLTSFGGGHDAIMHMGRLYTENKTANLLKTGKAHAIYNEQCKIAARREAEAAGRDPYAPAPTSDVSDIYDTVKLTGGPRDGRHHRRHRHHKNRRGYRGRAYGSFGARLFGRHILGSLLYPTLYRPVPYSYYPVPPGYWGPGYY